jgi:hypothetical protein
MSFNSNGPPEEKGLVTGLISVKYQIRLINWPIPKTIGPQTHNPSKSPN